MADDEQFEKCVAETPMFVPIDGWKPYRLPELASNGMPFSPTFILSKSRNSLGAAATSTGIAQPFGFHYRQQHAGSNRPVIDLTKGYYDPYTQVYTIPLQAGGDTDGGVIPTGYWTDTHDGNTRMREWDVMDDQVTD